MSYLRTTDHPIEPLFLDRWSPRSFEPEIMPDEDLLTILEAARWAPSAFNIQPWHFLYATRNGAHWDRFVGVLDDFNKAWARDAAVLFVLLSDTLMPGDANRPDRVSSVNSFDAGAAWAHLALQATARGYHAHAMAGIDREQARSALAIPARFRIEIAIAVGRRGRRSGCQLRWPSGRCQVTASRCPGLPRRDLSLRRQCARPGGDLR